MTKGEVDLGRCRYLESMAFCSGVAEVFSICCCFTVTGYLWDRFQTWLKLREKSAYELSVNSGYSFSHELRVRGSNSATWEEEVTGAPYKYE